MRFHPAALAAGLALIVLAGCAPDTAPEIPPAQLPAEIDLPEDAVLGLVGIATAANGATADVSLVVHASLPYLVPEASDAVATTLAWCEGEIDETILAARGYTFTAVDITLTPRDGDWPADTTLAVLPQPHPEFGSTLAAGQGLRQVDASDVDGFGDSVPHCRRPAVLDGAGGGTVFLGIPSDIAGANGEASFTAWAFHDFGFSAVLPGELGSTEVSFSSCLASVTQLGSEFGAPSATWLERLDGIGCLVGGAGLTDVNSG